MAHFAKINSLNIVEQVIVLNNDIIIDEDGNENEVLGSEFCEKLFGGRWIQTSYNGNFRGEYAGIGMIYSPEKDEFIHNETIS